MQPSEHTAQIPRSGGRRRIRACFDTAPGRAVVAPADPARIVGTVHEATAEEVALALEAAQDGFVDWSARSVAERTTVLRRIADLYEENVAELIAIASREAGKTLQDGIAEVREAVDFLRYYAAEADRREAEDSRCARGVFVCISPWNFPLAIFTGQIAAALAMGNAVLAKPAEQTPLIAARAVELMRMAGLPEAALQLLPGDGPSVGGSLTADPRIAGVCFTGSIEVAQIIHRSLAGNAGPDAVFIAETGGLNAMIVDSTALTEQAVGDILLSAFQSAGQRCSALRMLYVQEEAEEPLLEMLQGAMDALVDAGAPVTGLDGTVAAAGLAAITGVVAVAAAAGPDTWTRALRIALAGRSGPIVPLETTVIAPERYVVERHLCIDTTAAGGNASLLEAADRAP